MNIKIPNSLLQIAFLFGAVSVLLILLLRPQTDKGTIFLTLLDNPGYFVYQLDAQTERIECTSQLSSFGDTLSPNGQLSLRITSSYLHVFRNNSDCFASSSESPQVIDVRITGSSGLAAWSHDSRYVVFSVTPDWNSSTIYLLDIETEQLQLLLELPFNTLDFHWAPNGRQFMFISTHEGAYNIYVANADGSNLLLLGSVSPGFPHEKWSNDSTRIIVGTPGLDGPGDLYLFQADGSGQQFLGSVIGNISNIEWSPDDSQVLVVGSPWSGPRDTVYLMNSDGSNLRPLLTIQQFIFQLLWLPTEGEFIFIAGIPNASVYLANTSGEWDTLFALSGFPTRNMLVLAN
jgi:dipeptidyl aminopeptidase/acylaminoacyl peptidase